MGVFSKHHRYREAGEGPNVNNVSEYGVPARSLFTSTKPFSMHHRIEITDAYENVIYRAESKALSFRDDTAVFDFQGRQLASISKKVFSLHQLHYVEMSDGRRFELSTELMHLVKDIINIQGLGWQLQGNILAFNFALLDTDGSIIAVISQKAFSLHDKYCIDIYKPEHEPVCVAILVALQHIIRDREAASASSSGGSSGK